MEEMLKSLTLIYEKLARLESLQIEILDRLDEMELLRVYDLVEGPDYDPSQIEKPPTKDKITYVEHPQR